MAPTMIPNAELPITPLADPQNKELKSTLKQLRNACEMSQEELYQMAREKAYYVPASAAAKEDIEHVKSLYSQNSMM